MRTGRAAQGFVVCPLGVRRVSYTNANPCPSAGEGIDLGGMAGALAIDPLSSPIMMRACLIAAARQSAKDAAQAARDRIKQARASGNAPSQADTDALNKAADKINVADNHYFNHADEIVGTPEAQMTADQRFVMMRIGQIAVGLRDKAVGYVLAAGGREIYIEKTDIWQQGVPSILSKPLGEYFVIIYDVGANKLITIFTTSAKGVERAVESTIKYGEKVGDTGDVDLSSCWG